MTIQELFDLTAKEITTRIQESDGLTRFAYTRAKFEGWFKVELIDILVQKKLDAYPEIERIDVSFDSVGIELKIITTSFRYDNVMDKTRPITKNINGVINDIKKLRNRNFMNKFVIFIVFPATHNNRKWNNHLERITNKLEDYRHIEFSFKNKDIPGVIYYGQVE